MGWADLALCLRTGSNLGLTHPIGVGRFRILWGPRFRILGGQGGGANSQQAHDVDAT